MIVVVFTACSSKDNDTQTTTDTNTAITTDNASVTEADAINLIKSYSNEELGITEEQRESCSFMVASSGEYLEDYDANYVKVIVAEKIPSTQESGGEVTYTFDTKGEYYIRFDGKHILTKKDGEFTELEYKEVPTTTVPTTHSDEEKEE
jgi:hypothetical protein